MRKIWDTLKTWGSTYRGEMGNGLGEELLRRRGLGGLNQAEGEVGEDVRRNAESRLSLEGNAANILENRYMTKGSKQRFISVA